MTNPITPTLTIQQSKGASGWKLLPKDDQELEGEIFLLGLPNDDGDTQSTGYWSQERKMWIWAFDQPPTHYMELPSD